MKSEFDRLMMALGYLRGQGETVVSKKGGDWQLKLSTGDAISADGVEAFFDQAADACDLLVELKADYVQWRYEAKAMDFGQI